MSQIIDFEGLDYTGKTTCAHLLVQRLLLEKIPARYNSGAVYPIAKSHDLARQAETATDLERESIYTDIFILDNLLRNEDREVVVEDRYWPSVVVYGALINKEKSRHNFFRSPGAFLTPIATVYLTCEHSARLARSKDRKKNSVLDQLVQDPNIATMLDNHYLEILSSLPNVLIIDTTTRTPTEVVDKVYEEIREVLRANSR